MPEKATCEIHGLELKLQTVGVRYGMPDPGDPYSEVRRKYFPNSIMFVEGGCCEGSIGYEARALVCERCRKVEERWLEANRRPSLITIMPGGM